MWEVKWKSLSCVWLFVTSMGCSLPGSSVHKILQARGLKLVAISFSSVSSQLRDRTQVSCISGRFFTIWVTREAQMWVPCFISIPLPSHATLNNLIYIFPDFSLCISHMYMYIYEFIFLKSKRRHTTHDSGLSLSFNTILWDSSMSLYAFNTILWGSSMSLYAELPKSY